MDKIISKIAALGIPGLILMVSISATGLTGAAAITTSLVALGPGGMIGGIVTLGAIGIISEAISEYGFDAIFKSVIKELYKNGETKESIRIKVSKYPVSKSLKLKLLDELEKVSDQRGE